jgi:hypothetical protein
MQEKLLVQTDKIRYSLDNNSVMVFQKFDANSDLFCKD